MSTSKTRKEADCKKKRCHKWHWTFEEDLLLTTLIQRYGPGNWEFISDHIPERSGKSCRLRWMNQLNPKVNKRPFNDEERRRLLDLHREYGNKWSIIASHFPGRTDNQLKNQYHILVGSRQMKANGRSSCSGSLKRGSKGLSRNWSRLSTFPVGSQFSNVSMQENKFSGFDPCLICTIPDRMEMMPISNGGSSSFCGNGLCPRFFDNVNLANTYPNQTIIHGDSMMANSNSGAFSEHCPVPQPQQGLGFKDYKFVDFLGVGSSD